MVSLLTIARNHTNFPLDNSVTIPFVKVTLPKDKCDPIPKVKGGGLLGLALNFASSVVDGVVDSACNLVFPVLNKSPIPPWLALDIYPPAGDFPPDPEDDPEDDPTSSQTTTSSSSLCSASGVPQCTASCALTTVAGSQTTTCTQFCKTITACSGSGSITTISSSASGSPNSLIEDDAVNTEVN